MVKATTVYLGEDTVDEIDARRASTTSRSKWVKAACLARLRDEEAGDWEPPLPTDEPPAATTDGTAD